MRVFLSLVFSAVLPAFLSAQSLNERLDRILQSEFPPDAPGATVMVARNGEVIYHKAAGMANLELQVPMRVNNVMEIGSITKQFTAVAILMLMEEGKLQLDDDINNYLPDYPVGEQHITIRHLLTHTSGIHSYTSMPSWQPLWRKDLSVAELIDVFKDEPLDFNPGESWAYSNSGYILLGAIIEKASGQSYQNFIEQRIFAKAGMLSSRYGSHKELIPMRAAGYQSGSAGYVNAEYLSMTHPYSAGSLMSTVADLLTWNTALHSGQLMQPESLRLAFTESTLNNGEPTGYGLGWFLDEIGGSPTYEHAGGIFGFASNAIYLPDEKVYVAVLTNCDCHDPQSVATRMAAAAIGKPFPDESDIVKLDTAELRQFVGVYEFADGTFRNISLNNGQLFSERDGRKFELHHFGDNRFYFGNGLAQMHFKLSGDESTVHFVHRGYSTDGSRSAMSIPVPVNIAVPDEVLQRYVGVFNLMPNFDITFTAANGVLSTQATGQDKYELGAASETEFYKTEFGAKFEFIADEDGTYNRFILRQGGMELEGKRIR